MENSIKIKIDQATPNDSNDIFNWRNDTQTRLMSRSQEQVELDAHEKWLKDILNAPNKYLFIGSTSDLKVGICRFEINFDGTAAEVSINLNPQARGMGLSHHLLAAAIKEFRSNSRINLTATIKPANLASIKCFSRCGFVLIHCDSEYNYYRCKTGTE